MYRWRLIVLVFLFFYAGNVKGEEKSDLELKIDYYEALIKKGVRDAASYKPRLDNSDFFSGVDGTEIHDYGTFDFIVVGAGTSGCVVANRLSEIQRWKILVLEAGDEEDDLSAIPGLHTLTSNFRKTWGYVSTPQKHGCLGMIDRRCLVTRGRSIGGSSATGALIYSRGVEEDYNNWGQGWSFEELLPYFKKIEHYAIKPTQSNHGFAGPINIEHSQPDSHLHRAIAEGLIELGYERKNLNQNYNSFGKIQYNTRQGSRVSSGNTYLKEARTRLNVNITTRALVTKILFTKDKTANGVQFVKDGRFYEAHASKEVILSGGAINTPQLLMISGVGPREILRKHSIKLVQDLPVGQTLKDHYGYLSLYVRTNLTQSTPPLREMLKQYFDGYGYLTKSLNSEVLAYSSKGRPNIEYIFAPPTGTKVGLYASKRFTKDMLASVSKRINITTDLAISVTLLHPKSTGKILLKSSNPVDFPEIDLGIFNDLQDVQEIYKGIKNILKILKTPSFQKINASIYSTPKPCEDHEFNSEAFWHCSIRHISFAAHQLTSTTKMGPDSDPEAVVDRNLRVYGVKNLRVADCGVVPVTVSGQLNAVAYVIGEKAGDLLKEHHLKDEYSDNDNRI